MSHKKSRIFRHRFAQSVRALTQTLGWLALGMAVLVWLLSLRQQAGSRANIQNISGILALVGTGNLVLFALFFRLPDFLAARSSPSRQRRDAIYKHNRNSTRPRPEVVPQRNDGSVLVVVLAVLAAVTALVLQVQLTSRARLHAQQSASRRASLVRAATDAARTAMQRLADDPELMFDSRDEDWARRDETRSPPGIDTIVTVTDENRFFDLNNLARRADMGVLPADEIAMNLLNECGQFDAGDRIRALQDWIDADNNGVHESEIYLSRDPPYACPNRPLISWNELFDIDGWKREQFALRPPASVHGTFEASLPDCVTVLPAKHDRLIPVNINTASRDVLLGILGIDQDVLVNAIISMRTMRPIQTVDAVQQLMEPALFAHVSPYLAVRSEFFRIEARAFAEGAAAHIRAIAHRDAEGRVDVAQWMF